jgi:hypothetical protein
MSCLCCWIKFCSTQYNSPRTFGLASYSVVFCDLCRVSAFAYLHWPLKLHLSLRVQPLRPKHYPFSYQITGLVLHRSQHHLLLSSDSGYPCGPVSHCSFLYSQRLCYLHRSYQWRDPRGPEQACVNELLPAELRRLTSFGSVTRLILCRAGRTILHRTLRCPSIYCKTNRCACQTVLDKLVESLSKLVW